MGTNEAETIARNILASHSKGDDGGGVPGQEVLGAGEGRILNPMSQPAGTQGFEPQLKDLTSAPTPSLVPCSRASGPSSPSP